ncbi:unnamed protein product [Albugo candida]|uniref:Uncharacterized protein n=1 Tax=Albugo candida TaxID=65357 RepID=A0A024GKK2_9STRA|nr:unnamed protein product [Albugo candida]|eukprot:CCI47298.1 unnamed protein product [Albugo candida]
MFVPYANFTYADIRKLSIKKTVLIDLQMYADIANSIPFSAVEKKCSAERCLGIELSSQTAGKPKQLGDLQGNKQSPSNELRAMSNKVLLQSVECRDENNDKNVGSNLFGVDISAKKERSFPHESHPTSKRPCLPPTRANKRI